MTPDRWKQVNRILEETEGLDEAELSSVLDRACAGDPGLRRDVEEMLRLAKVEDDFLARPLLLPAEPLPATVPEETDSLSLGSRVGVYRVVSLLGRGGMGSVYEAERADDQYRQRVALKVVKSGMDTSSILKRFRGERQILARLDHPNIARLLDGGCTSEGRPYLVMEFIEGQPVTAYCDANRLGIRARLQLFRDICSAVHHAHRALIVHRDLKPANILITSEGVPKLLDFGIAKLLQPDPFQEEMTQTVGAHPMTPEYASPEQVRGEPVTTGVDVYALGVILYELLTGQRPYQWASLPEMERAICDTQPSPPSVAARSAVETAIAQARGEEDGRRLSRRLSGDLDNIVLMALRKEAARRYVSAEQLSEDIRRYLDGEPVAAQRDTAWYRAGKFVHRHKVGVAAAVLVAVSLSAGIVAASWQAHIARIERQEANSQRVRADRAAKAALDAQAKAEEQARVTEAERAKAQKRFEEIRSLAGSFLFDFHDAIQYLPGATAARHLVINKAQEYLDRLERERSDDVDLLLEVAQAHNRVAAILGDPYGPNLGDSPGAMRNLEKALATARRADRLRPAEPRIQRTVGTLYMHIADVQQQLKATDRAQRNYAAAEAILEKLAAADPRNSDLRLDLARLNQRVAEFLRTRNELAGALRRHARTVSLLRELASEHHRESSWLNNLGISLTLYADALHRSGERDRAKALYQEALDASREALRLDPNNSSYKRSVALRIERLGNFYRAIGDIESALKQYRDSSQVAEQISAADPNDKQALRDVYVVQIKLGSLELSRGGTAQAAAGFLKAAAIAERLTSENPENRLWRKDLAIVYDRMAGLRTAEGNIEQALDYSEKCIQVLKGLAASDPQNRATEGDVAYALEKKADLLARSERRQQAIPLLTSAVEIRERHTKDSPEDIQLLREMSRTVEKLGKALDREGGHDAAIPWLRKTKEALEHLVRLPHAEADDFNSYAVFLAESPILEWRNPNLAVEYATRAVQMTRSTNPVYLETLAKAQFAAGEREKALATAESALRLIPQDPSELRKNLESTVAQFRKQQ